MPCSSAAAITSASRIEPPGCTTAVAPAAATASRPSRNGKNASDAATDPCSRICGARRAGLHDGHLHRIDAAHLARADRQRAIRAGEDHGVRLHVRADAPREAQRRHSSGRRLPLGHHLQTSGRGSVHGRARLAHHVARLHEHGAENRPQLERRRRRAPRSRRPPRACWPSSPGPGAHPRPPPAR